MTATLAPHQPGGGPWGWKGATAGDGQYVLTFDGNEVGTVSLLPDVPLRAARLDVIVTALNNPTAVVMARHPER